MSEYRYRDEEAISRERRMQRRREMQRRKKKQILIRKCIRLFAPIVVILVIVVALATGGKKEKEREADNQIETVGSRILSVQTGLSACMEAVKAVQEEQFLQEEPVKVYTAQETAQMEGMGEIESNYGILIDPVNDTILAGKQAKARINPASMTKVLTALVAAEHVENLDDTIVITSEITDYGYIHDCSSAGFDKNQTVTIRELFYGTLLPSGGDAAMGLAVYVAGDHETFVDMMNAKLEELGLSQTSHMTNCIGVYDANHYSTPYDMAIIMEAALDNELCREVMSVHTYVGSPTEARPEGNEMSNWFLRRIEDRDTGGEVICAKTGYVKEAGSCAVSYAKDMAGNEYICVTADASNQWKCIEDHEEVYKKHAKGDD